MAVSKSGCHLLAEMYGIEREVLLDEKALVCVYESILLESNFTILGRISHAFTTHGNGITVVFLLSESHATIHTYPEWRSASLDIFSCGSADPRVAFRRLVERLDPGHVVVSVVGRYFAHEIALGCRHRWQTAEHAAWP
jgi:S-adenosylmethionine decarboxylase